MQCRTPGTLQKLAEALPVPLLLRLTCFHARQLSVLLQHLQRDSMHVRASHPLSQHAAALLQDRIRCR